MANQRTKDLFAAAELFGLLLDSEQPGKRQELRNFPWHKDALWWSFYDAAVDGGEPKKKIYSIMREYLQKNPQVESALMNLAEQDGPFLFNHHPMLLSKNRRHTEIDLNQVRIFFKLLGQLHLNAQDKGRKDQAGHFLSLWWDISSALEQIPDSNYQSTAIGQKTLLTALLRQDTGNEKYFLPSFKMVGKIQTLKNMARLEAWRVNEEGYFVHPLMAEPEIWFFEHWKSDLPGRVWMKNKLNGDLKYDVSNLPPIFENYPCLDKVKEKIIAAETHFDQNAWDYYWGGIQSTYLIPIMGKSSRLHYDLDLTMAILETRIALEKSQGYWPDNQEELNQFVSRAELPLSLSCDENQFVYSLSDEGINISIEGSRKIFQPKKGIKLPLEFTVKKPEPAGIAQ